MDEHTPTHFNVIFVGTGLTESIAAAALSKAGYSVLQLDQATYYGDEWASLSLSELVEWAAAQPHAAATPSEPPAELTPVGQRFALSLTPTLLRAKGTAIDLLIRSKVASYLSFGLLGGVGLWKGGDGDKDDSIERVPASKADVFHHPKLSLVEKRRLTKLLLLASGAEPFEANEMLSSDPSTTLETFLAKSCSLSPAVSDSLAYALSLCSSPDDLALPALERLRSVIHSTGRYGTSPYLVGHYGGAGDLVGGFSRICAVWGGGQILGRPMHALIRDAEPSKATPALEPLFAKSATQPPPPPSQPTGTDQDVKPLGIPVELESGTPPTTFTADWVVCAPSHLSLLTPSSEHRPVAALDTVNAVIILPSAVPFPTPREVPPDENNEPDSNLFVFPPKALQKHLGTCTALQVGAGTCATPAGYFALYLSAPLLAPPATGIDAAATLKPYIDSLLRLADTPIQPLYAVTYYCARAMPPSSNSESDSDSLPANLLVVPPLPSSGTTASLITSLDEAAEEAERIFWRVVGQQGRDEGVEFFPREPSNGDEDDD